MATAHNLFEYTATGILGDQRRSMLKNELHLRVKVTVLRLDHWARFLLICIARTTSTVYGRTAPPVKNWRILLVQSFTARMPFLLTASSAFGLGRRRWSSPQQCYLFHHPLTLSL